MTNKALALPADDGPGSGTEHPVRKTFTITIDVQAIDEAQALAIARHSQDDIVNTLNKALAVRHNLKVVPVELKEKAE